MCWDGDVIGRRTCSCRSRSRSQQMLDNTKRVYIMTSMETAIDISSDEEDFVVEQFRPANCENLHSGEYTNSVRVPVQKIRICDSKCVGCVQYNEWFRNKTVHRTCNCSECQNSRCGNDGGSHPCVRTCCVETVEGHLIGECISQWDLLYQRYRRQPFNKEGSEYYYKTITSNNQVRP